MWRSEEDLSDGAEVFLACRIPDMQLAELVLNSDQECVKLHTNCGLALKESFLGQPFQEWWFTAASITDCDDLEDVVAVFFLLVSDDFFADVPYLTQVVVIIHFKLIWLKD